MDRGVANYRVGQIIHHKLFNYRGVIIDVDANFSQSEAWYTLMARTKPNKDQPWYHVLVHDTDYVTYVAEQNLEPDFSETPINHPELTQHFSAMRDGLYFMKRQQN